MNKEDRALVYIAAASPWEDISQARVGGSVFLEFSEPSRDDVRSADAITGQNLPPPARARRERYI